MPTVRHRSLYGFICSPFPFAQRFVYDVSLGGLTLAALIELIDALRG